MIAVDTNILVRYAVKDDRRQTVAATGFLARRDCFVSRTVLLETAWVLGSSSGYALPKAVVVERLRHILGLPGVTVEDPVGVAKALEWFEGGMEIADAMHLSAKGAIDGFATLDARMARSSARQAKAPHVTLLKP